MRVAIVTYRKDLLKENLKRIGHKVVKHRPEIVVALGGDGTFLWAEKVYPGVPKVFIYDSKTCPKCSIVNVADVLAKLGIMKFREEIKLEAFVGKKKISALNDINIHYTPPRALRYDVQVNGKSVAENVIGDGVVVSTPFGSPAYFHSITGKTFRKGIGIAFNNLTKKMKTLVVKDDSVIKVVIKRENGIAAWDTEPKPLKIKEGTEIIIRKSPVSVKVALFKKDRK